MTVLQYGGERNKGKEWERGEPGVGGAGTDAESEGSAVWSQLMYMEAVW